VNNHKQIRQITDDVGEGHFALLLKIAKTQLNMHLNFQTAPLSSLLNAVLSQDSRPVFVARSIANLLNIKIRVTGAERIPVHGPCLVVSNHRSVADMFLLLAGLNRPIHFICHPFLARVPGVNELIRQSGGIHLRYGKYAQFFEQAGAYLREGQWLGIFPEGAKPMTQRLSSDRLYPFQRGVSHLAFKSKQENLCILPVALRSIRELSGDLVPMQFFSLLDPQEPLFQEQGWHPYVVYREVEIVVGSPRYLTLEEQWNYDHGKARSATLKLTQDLEDAIKGLLTDRQ
jgi:1-acyl-sn-glycerol-3-phosphate acyltransferase